jgi:hypothetical protein
MEGGGATVRVSSALSKDLQDILEGLRERKTKSRKDALERLNHVVFANESNVSQLDALTFGVPPRDHERLGYATEYVTWTAILTALMDGVQDDVAKSLQKGLVPDSIYSRVVRMVVNKATGQRDRKLYSMLEPVSMQLMSHLTFILERTIAFRKSSQVFNDYSATLKILLESEKFRVRSSQGGISTHCMNADDFESTLKPLCRMILQNVEGSREDNTTASFMVKDLTVLRSVLAHMRYDMAQETRSMLIKILESYGQNQNLRDWTSRICNEVLGLCVQTMLYCRGDALNELVDVTKRFHHSALLLLREGNPEGREAALLYFRVAMRLELLDVGLVKEVVDWYQGLDLETSWVKSPECADYALSQEQSLLALLLAELEVNVYRRLSRDVLAGVNLDGAMNVAMDGNLASAKRKRQNRRLGFDIVSDAIGQPAALGPVACVFLLKHGRCLSGTDFESACLAISSEVVSVLQHSFVSEHVKPDVVWILRMLYSTVVAESERAGVHEHLDESVHQALAGAISFLIKQYKLLSSYVSMRDVVKMIVIVGLPRLQDAIFLGNSSTDAESFREELLSETPSATSLVLVTLLLRYKKLSSLSRAVVHLYIDWMTKALTSQESTRAPVSSDIVCMALCMLLFGGDTTSAREIESHVRRLMEEYQWWRSVDIEMVMDALPPVNGWSLYSELNLRGIDDEAGRSHGVSLSNYSQHAVAGDPSGGAVEYLCDALERILDTCVLEDETLNVSALCLDLMSRVNKDDPRSGDGSMDEAGNEGIHSRGIHPVRFASLQSFTSKCIAWITTRVMACSNIHKSGWEPIFRVSDALSRLAEQDKDQVRPLLEGLPLLKDALNHGMSVMDANGDDEPGSFSQPQYRMGPITGGARDHGGANRRIPMLHWYLEVLERTCCFEPTKALEDLMACYQYFSDTKYYLALEVRMRMAALESSCILSMLARGDVPLHLDKIHFLDGEGGLFSYDHEFIFRTGIFEDILHRGFALVKQVSALEDGQVAKRSMSSVSKQLLRLIEASVEVKTSSIERTMAADIIVSLMEIDPSLVPESMFEPLVEWLATLVVDRYAVRVAAASILPRLLSFFSEPKILFQKILEMLPLESNESEDKIIPIDCDLDELLRTVVFTLATVAANVADLELICVSCLIQELQYDEGTAMATMQVDGSASEPTAMNEAVMDALGWVAKSMGYGSFKSYMTVMSRSIIAQLMQNPKRVVFCLEKYLIACRLVGVAGVPGEEVLLAFLVYHRSVTGVRALMEYLKVKHFPMILRKSMGEVCAAHFFASSVDHGTIDGLLMDMVQNLSSMASLLHADLDLEKMMGDLSDDIITKIIGHRRDAGNSQGASEVFSKEVRAITALAVRLALDGQTMSSMPRPVDTMMLLMSVQKKISDFKHPRHKVQAVKAVTCAVLYVEGSLDNPGILRQVLAIVSILMRYSTTSKPACEILIHLIDHVVLELDQATEYEHLIQTIGIMLPTIMSYMCDSYESSKSSNEHVVKCIRYLMLNSEPAYVRLREHTSVLDPRIDGMLGEDGSLGADTPVSSYIQSFGELVGLLSPSTRLEYISTIQRKMRDALWADPPSADLIAEKSLWKIVHAASLNQEDRCLVDFAGQLVAHFGPLKPSVLSFNPAQFGALAQCKEPPSCLTRDTAVEILECDTYRGALLLLYDYIVEDDSHAASAAFRILQEILSTPSGVSAFNTLDDIVREHFNLFLHSRIGEMGDRGEEELSPELDARLWKLDGLGGPVPGSRSNSRYDDWVTRIGHDVLSKSKSAVLVSCAKLAKIRANFAETLLPLAFVHVSLDQVTSAELGTLLGGLITEHSLPHFANYPKMANLLLRVLHSLRRLYDVDKEAAEGGQASSLARLPWKTMYWVTVDYLDLAEACIASRSLYSGIIFTEMWRETREREASKEEFQRSERLMQELYALLPEPDGLYAMSRSNDAMSQLRRFEREGDWSRAMVISDLALQMQEENPHASVLNIPRRDALNCMRRCLDNLGASYLLSSTSSMELDLDVEPGSSSVGPWLANTGSVLGPGHAVASPGAAALGEWCPMQTSSDSAGSETADSHLALAVKHLQIGYQDGFIESLHSVREEVISLLASASRETTADLNPLIVKAQMAECIAEAWHLKWEIDLNDRNNGLELAITSWCAREAAAGAGWRFSLDMPMKDLRKELLQIMGREDLKARCLLDIAVCARKADRNGQALGALSRFRRSIQSVSSSSVSWAKSYRLPEANWRVEEAKNFWAQNQRDAAIMTLLSNSAQCTEGRFDSDNIVSVAYLNCLLAKWLAITQRESSQTILNTLIETTDALLDEDTAGADPSTSDKACRIFYRMASYADQLRTEIAQRKLSVEWVKAKSILEKNRRQMEEMASKLETAKKQSKDKQMIIYSMNKLNRTIQEDENDIESTETNELQYETLAIRGYCMALRNGSRYDLPATFRLIDRWLAPRSAEHKDEINEVFGQESQSVPSHKLIPLGYQLASRLAETSKGGDELARFQTILKSTIFRMANEHPFHMLPILFALKNGAKAKHMAGSRGGLAFQANASRIHAASEIITKASKINSRMAQIVDELDCATQGYIEIAMSDVESPAPFPAKWRRKFCKELTNIPLLSVLLPFDLTLKYADLPTIASIDEMMKFPGGINKPKLVTLTDSHGQTRRQLVKGKDDLRQDAVMQQFFRICNAFLQEAKATASRNLAIGTYFALPFSPSSGLLEWLDNTESLEEFIADGNRKYHRATRQVMRKVMDVQTKKGWNETASLKERKKLFDQCVKDLGPPRMARVFLRRFSDPGRWFQARLAYTRSVAVNSMAGHIIGLGDRHLSNILLSKATADVIHIDLGIAFEQGKLLRTPEQVPFRLTRNMVDAMGAAGVEGVMRRCCEQVLRVMRKHKEPIVTVLSVFIHDPLYTWSLAHDRVGKDRTSQCEDRDDHANANEVNDIKNTNGDNEGNMDANRTLLVIKQKLEGRIGGDSTARGIEGQVQYLLQVRLTRYRRRLPISPHSLIGV